MFQDPRVVSIFLTLWVFLGILFSMVIYPFFCGVTVFNSSFDREKSLYYLKEQRRIGRTLFGVGKMIVSSILILMTLPIGCIVIYFAVFYFTLRLLCSIIHK